MSRATPASPEAVPILALENIEVLYEQIIVALRGISLEVRTGTIVALLGANGSGKTTTLKAISGLLPAERGQLVTGSIQYDGAPAAERTPRELVRAGLVQVLEGRHCFSHLTIEENLRVGAFARRATRSAMTLALERVFTFLPRLKARRRLAAGFASGGEQQMLALGRALMANPKLVLLDEPSMGLAPQVVAEIFEIVRDLNQKEGMSFLLAEQNARMTLRYADFGYVLSTGRVAASGSARELVARPDVTDLYLGASSSRRKRAQAAKSSSADA